MEFAQRLIALEQAAFWVANRVVRNRDDARDVVQDAYCRALAHRDSFEPDRPVRPWFLQIVRNAALDRLRAIRREKSEIVEPAGASGCPSDHAIAQERRITVHLAMRALPERYRHALALRYFEGYRYHEISAALRIPVGTAQTFVHRGRAALREQLTAAAQSGVRRTPEGPKMTR